MSNSSKSRTTNQTPKSGQDFDSYAKAVFEKIQINSEEIGKLKMEPFNVATVERVRAFYRENDRLFIDLMKGIK